MKKIIFILICFVTQNSIGYGQKDNIQYCYFVDNQNVIEKKMLVRYPDIELSKLALLTSYSAINSIVFIPDSTVFEKVSLKINFAKNTINEKRFAKKVLEGDISLYVLGIRATELPIGYLTKTEEIYIVKKDTQYYTLTNFEAIQDDNKIKKENKYYGILNYLLRDVPDMASALERTDFDEKSLIKLITLYNTRKNPKQKPIVFSQKSKTIVQNFGIGTDFLYYGTISDEYNAANVNLNIGAYYSLKYPHLSDKTSLLFGMRYTHFPKNAENYLSVLFLLNYDFQKKDNFAINVAVGSVMYLPYSMVPTVRLGWNSGRLSIQYHREFLSLIRDANQGISLYYSFATKIKSK